MGVTHLVVALLAEDLADFLLAGLAHFAEMSRHRLDRLGLTVFQRQHRREVNDAEGADADMHLTQEGIAQVRRTEQQIVAGRAKLHVGDHAEEALLLAADHHIAADCQLFRGHLSVQADLQPTRQRAGDHPAQTLRDGQRRESLLDTGAGQRVELGVEIFLEISFVGDSFRICHVLAPNIRRCVLPMACP